MYSGEKVTGRMTRRAPKAYYDAHGKRHEARQDDKENLHALQFQEQERAKLTARLEQERVQAAQYASTPRGQPAQREVASGYRKNASQGMSSLFAAPDQSSQQQPNYHTQQGYNKRNASQPMFDGYGPTDNFMRKQGPVNADYSVALAQEQQEQEELRAVRQAFQQRDRASDLFQPAPEQPITRASWERGQQATAIYAHNSRLAQQNSSRAHTSRLILDDTVPKVLPITQVRARKQFRSKQESSIFGASINLGQQVRNPDKV
jgi:hypothetical protein